jgi:hypothetical protein
MERGDLTPVRKKIQTAVSDSMHVARQQGTLHCVDTNIEIRDCVIPIPTLLFLLIPSSFKHPLSNA